MTRLLDVNLLLALCWSGHQFHEPVRAWFESLYDPWATCALTQCAFIRLSMIAPVRTQKVNAVEAQQALAQLCRIERHLFLPDDGQALAMDLTRVTGHNQVNDAYLLALAKRHQALLSTLDTTLHAVTGNPGIVEVVRVK